MINSNIPIHVLIAEDEPVILEHISRKVEAADPAFIVIDRVQNGLEALASMSRQLPHVLLTDIRMPMMDGLELIKSVRNQYPNVYIVILSGYSEFTYAQQAMRYGIADYLLKPLKSKELQETLLRIRNALESAMPEVNKAALSPPMEGDTSTETPVDLIETIEVYMNEHFSTPITLESIAQKFNFNPSYFIRLFKKYKEVTPTQYIITLRMNEAKRLMTVRPELDFKQIAERVGYTDSHYFSRLFKSTTGISPSEYRAGMRNPP